MDENADFSQKENQPVQDEVLPDDYREVNCKKVTRFLMTLRMWKVKKHPTEPDKDSVVMILM